MALQPVDLYDGPTAQSATKRIAATWLQAKSFEAGSATFLAGTPVGVVAATGFWDDWLSGTAQIHTLTADGTPASAGTFTLTFNGLVTTAIAFGATAAVVQAALEALANVAVGDVAAVATTGANLSVANAVVTLTWIDRADMGALVLTADQTLISAGNDFVLAVSQAGVAGVPMSGIAWPDDIVQDAAGEVIGNVLMAGCAHIDDIELPAGETLASLKIEVKTRARLLGIKIEGYEDVS